MVGSDLRLPDSPRSLIKNQNNNLTSNNNNNLHQIPGGQIVSNNPGVIPGVGPEQVSSQVPTPSPRSALCNTKSPKSQLSPSNQTLQSHPHQLQNYPSVNSVTVTHISFNGQQVCLLKTRFH